MTCLMLLLQDHSEPESEEDSESSNDESSFEGSNASDESPSGSKSDEDNEDYDLEVRPSPCNIADHITDVIDDGAATKCHTIHCRHQRL